MVKKVITYQQISGIFQNRSAKVGQNRAYDMDSYTCMSKLSCFYREELEKKGRNPELTAVQRWSQYIQEIMIEEAGESFVRHYDQLMDGSFYGDLFDDTFSGYLISAISELSEKYIYTSSVKTKTELGDAYGMKSYGGARYEWYQQAANFSAYAVGKTAQQILEIPTAEGKPAQSDLYASVTISITPFQRLIARACGLA